jgi:hypothetical protein
VNLCFFSLTADHKSALAIVALIISGMGRFLHQLRFALITLQAMIEDRFNPSECPAALHDGHTWDHVIGDCLSLHRIARNLRATRFNELGALRLDNMRLFYKLDKDGNPVGGHSGGVGVGNWYKHPPCTSETPLAQHAYLCNML